MHSRMVNQMTLQTGRRILFLMLALASLGGVTVMADVAPPMKSGGTSLAKKDYGLTNVSIVDEVVKLQVSRATCHVDVVITMTNRGKAAETIPVGFSHYHADELKDFKASVDGSKIVVANESGKTVGGSIMQPASHYPYWKFWMTTFPPGKPVKIVVSYWTALSSTNWSRNWELQNVPKVLTSLVPENEQTAMEKQLEVRHVTYELGMNKNWSGPIGRCRIEVSFEGMSTDNLSMDGIRFEKNQYTITSNTIIWDLKDYTPDRDCEIEFTPFINRVTLLQLLQRLQQKHPTNVLLNAALVNSLNTADRQSEAEVVLLQFLKDSQDKIVLFGTPGKHDLSHEESYKLLHMVEQITGKGKSLRLSEHLGFGGEALLTFEPRLPEAFVPVIERIARRVQEQWNRLPLDSQADGFESSQKILEWCQKQSLGIGAVLADAPPPMTSGGTNPANKGTGLTNVSIADQVVKLRVSRESCHVDVDFTMTNKGNDAETIPIGFPFFHADELKDFEATVDGTKIEFAGESGKVVGGSVNEPAAYLPHWKSWTTTFPPGKPVTIAVSYSTELSRANWSRNSQLRSVPKLLFGLVPEQDRAAMEKQLEVRRVTYQLWTPHRFSGPIGRCRIEATLEGISTDNLTLDGIEFEPGQATITSDKIIWDLKSHNPESGYHVEFKFTPFINRKDMLSLLERLRQNNPTNATLTAVLVEYLNAADRQPEAETILLQYLNDCQDKVVLSGPRREQDLSPEESVAVFILIKQISGRDFWGKKPLGEPEWTGGLLPTFRPRHPVEFAPVIKQIALKLQEQFKPPVEDKLGLQQVQIMLNWSRYLTEPHEEEPRDEESPRREPHSVQLPQYAKWAILLLVTMFGVRLALWTRPARKVPHGSQSTDNRGTGSTESAPTSEPDK